MDLKAEISEEGIVIATNHFTEFTVSETYPVDYPVPGPAPTPTPPGEVTPEEEEYIYKDCTTYFVDDSYAVDEDPDDDIDRTPCVIEGSSSFGGSTDTVGAIGGSRYSMWLEPLASSKYTWQHDYKNLSGTYKIFATVPNVARVLK
ncbi:MAG: hypothetical protein Q9M91_03555 [Candidatus Dojkabacteria bacterium]|nr:hypothetical protein [Candidatus Dojkabacteria bacterium]MDQ7020897.1 hypothetical protein [Candidatus Dojkabacteria bacterium]